MAKVLKFIRTLCLSSNSRVIKNIEVDNGHVYRYFSDRGLVMFIYYSAYTDYSSKLGVLVDEKIRPAG